MRYVALALVILAAATTSTRARATTESRAAVLFLLIEPGIRASGLGGAYVAIADDATATYFNPAGLAGQSSRSFRYTHTKWLPKLADDLFYEYVAYSQPIEGVGNIGANVTFLTYGEQIHTDEFGTELGTFSSYDLAISGSYGTYLSEQHALGVTIKWIHSRLAPFGAGAERGKGIGNSFGVDVGWLWREPLSGLTLGATLRNVGPKISYIDARQADPLPQHLVVGGAYKALDTEYNDILVALDVYKPLINDDRSLMSLVTSLRDEEDEFKEMDFHIGAEYAYANILALRTGYFYDDDGERKTPTFGAGLHINPFTVDIAYIVGEKTPLQDTIRFSLAVDFSYFTGKKK